MIYTSGSEFQSLRSVPVPLRIFCMSLLVNTPDSDNQLIRSALRAWTVLWLTCSLYTVSIAPYSLRREIRCSLLHFGTFIQGLRCATSLSIASVHYNRLWSITELIPNRPRLHRDALYKWLISPLLCRVRKLLDLIKNIKICVLKMNISFVVLTGLMCLERHEGE